MAEGQVLRLTQTGQSQQSLLLTDIEDYNRQLGQLDKASDIPVYVPTTGSVDLPYASFVAESFENGSIRKFIDAGYITFVFVFSDLFATTIVQTAIDAGLTIPPGLHATSHEFGGVDTLAPQKILSPSTVLGRDGDDRVLTVTYTGGDVWTVTRDGDGLLASLSNGTITKTINRDGNGLISSVIIT